MNRAVWLGPVLLLLIGWGIWRAPVDMPTPEVGEGSPQRLVSLAPSLTEIILALDRGERLVGVTRFCEGVRPEVRRVGDLRFDVEAILALRPDRVFAIETQSQVGLRKALAGRGIAVEVLPAETVDDIRFALGRLGQLLEAEEAAATWVSEIDRALRTQPEGPLVRGLFVVERQSLTVAGGGSFVDEMLRAAGIENVFGKETWSYQSVELETIAARNPVIILDASFTESEAREPGPFWSRFHSLRAVQGGGVSAFPPVRPGVKIPAWVEQLRREARARRE
jgi:iron complex transport system substrate-binding protein